MEIGIPQDNLTFDASAKTITMGGYYADIEREQILLIKNLTTGDTIYNSLFPNKYNIAVSSGVITHTYDNDGHADTDILQITVILSESMGYDSTTDSLKMTEQAPVDQQVLDELLLNAVTATGASTDVTVLDKARLTFVVVASSVTTGGTLKFQGSPDGTNYVDISTFAAGALTAAASQAISADGTYIFTVDGRVAVKHIRANLSARTDGTYSVYLFGGAI